MEKQLTVRDRAGFDEAVSVCTEILARFGIERNSQFLGTLNAGHPGGMLPLSSADAVSLHPAVLPEGLYVADATVLPESTGAPPILTILALAGRIARVCRERYAPSASRMNRRMNPPHRPVRSSGFRDR